MIIGYNNHNIGTYTYYLDDQLCFDTLLLCDAINLLSLFSITVLHYLFINIVFEFIF